MKMKNLILILALFGVLSLSGCASIQYAGKQAFKEDGTSTMNITEYVGIKKDALSSLDALTKTESASSVELKGIVDYYTSSAYGEFLCGQIKNKAVESCTPNSDGSVTVKVNLAPGDFYNVQSSTDWVNLKESQTYTIEKAPMALYYVMEGSGDPESYQAAATEDLENYIRSNIDNYLTKDAYCDGTSSITCEVVSLGGNKADIKLSTSYSTYAVSWVGCTDTASDDFLFMNQSEARAEMPSVTEVNKSVSSSSPLLVSLNCPSGSKSLVIGYKLKSSYGGSDTSLVDAFALLTKQAMADKAIEELDTSSDSTGTSSLTSLSTEDYVIDFKSGTLSGSDYEELTSSSSSYLSSAKNDVKIAYSATFPDKVVSATMGSSKLSAANNRLELSLRDLETGPKAPILVVTEKEISPLGIFTWAIPLVLLVIVAIGLASIFMHKPATPPPM